MKTSIVMDLLFALPMVALLVLAGRVGWNYWYETRRHPIAEIAASAAAVDRCEDVATLLHDAARDGDFYLEDDGTLLKRHLSLSAWHGTRQLIARVTCDADGNVVSVERVRQ